MKVHALIADDEPNQLELIAYNLNSAGFEVTRASNGEEALRLAEDILPDIIIHYTHVNHFSFLKGINAHYHIMSKEDYKAGLYSLEIQEQA